MFLARDEVFFDERKIKKKEEKQKIKNEKSLKFLGK